jgi:hypothetical protein
MLRASDDEEEEEKEPGEETGIADDLLDEIDDSFIDESLETAAVVTDPEEDEEKVDFDRHDDVDKI